MQFRMANAVNLSLLVLIIHLLDPNYKQLIEQVNVNTCAIKMQQLSAINDSQRYFHGNEFVLMVSMDTKLTQLAMSLLHAIVKIKIKRRSLLQLFFSCNTRFFHVSPYFFILSIII